MLKHQLINTITPSKKNFNIFEHFNIILIFFFPKLDFVDLTRIKNIN
jgi:hypothetical protein